MRTITVIFAVLCVPPVAAAQVSTFAVTNDMKALTLAPTLAPALACTDAPTSPLNKVTFSVSSNCLGCSGASNQYLAWNNPETSVHSTTPAHLPPKGSASVSLRCAKEGTDYRIVMRADNTSLAGWGGVPGNYRRTSSAVGGTAYSGFNVPDPGAGKVVCMRLLTRTHAQVRTKGYPGSYQFNEGTSGIEAITFRSPSGKFVGLPAPGNAIELPERGTWLVVVQYASDYSSNWAENSGRFQATDNALIRFTIQPAMCG